MNAVLEVNRSRIGVATYLGISGALVDPEAVERLREDLKGCIDQGDLHLVLDLANVPLIASAALEALLDAQDQLTRAGGDIKLVHANAALREVLHITGLNQRMSLIDEAGVPEHTPPQSAPLRGRRLGELLIERGLADEKTILAAVELQQSNGKRLGHILVDRGTIKESALLEVLSGQFGLPLVQLRTGVYDPEVVRTLSIETARKLRVAPLFRIRKEVVVASNDPQAIPSFDSVEQITGARVRVVLAPLADILRTLTEAHGEDHQLAEYIGELDLEQDLEVVENRDPDDYSVIDEVAAGSPVINLVNGLIQRAVADGASDIHIEPSRGRSRVRLRIDGVLYQTMRPPADIHPSLVSRLKVMANLDIAERRLPQDGRIQVYTRGRTIDLRMSTLPGINGEKVVLRVLDKSQSITDIGGLGLSPDNLERFKALLSRSYGLILVTGPTGSGKTTTLYAGLNYLNSIEKSIVTIEDPVEYQLDVINQNQIKDAIGLSFARVLRHVLRQDPDVIMVGEIRDRETAEIAVQAALTGHVVLSTLHTNDSTGAITRLLDMGIEPFLLSSALIGIMAQRLIRTVCPECKTSYAAPPGSLAQYGVTDDGTVRLVRGRGCNNCYDSGYKGRIAIHELLECDAALQQLMISSPSRDALADHVHGRGIGTLFDDGVARAMAGVTTIEEVARVVNS